MQRASQYPSGRKKNGRFLLTSSSGTRMSDRRSTRARREVRRGTWRWPFLPGPKYLKKKKNQDHEYKRTTDNASGVEGLASRPSRPSSALTGWQYVRRGRAAHENGRHEEIAKRQGPDRAGAGARGDRVVHRVREHSMSSTRRVF